MWRFLDGVSDPSKSKKDTSEGSSSKQTKTSYDKAYDLTKRKRKFLPKWKIGRPWLVDGESGMKCTVCSELEESLRKQGVVQSRVFLEGCTSYKAESIALHENSSCHKSALLIASRKANPATAPAIKASKALNKAHTNKVKLLFRNAHALAKYRRPFTDYKWLCELDEVKGLEPGKTYRNETSCRTFTKFIASTIKDNLAETLESIPFIGVTADGSTDSARTEQEILFIRFVEAGHIRTEFGGIVSPKSPDAVGVYNAILQGLANLNITEECLQKKLVGFGCDGANVMVGKRGGVATFLAKLQPSMIVIHCLAHRLELAYKDAIRSCKLYSSALVLLMGVYYFYHNSPKQRENLKNSFASLEKNIVLPTRVGGTRWVGHMWHAVDNFLRAFQAIERQMADCVTQAGQGESKKKALGYLKLLRRADIIAFIHLLKDALQPLKILSAALQSNQTTLADAKERIHMAKEVLTVFTTSNGPSLSMFFTAVEPNNCLSNVKLTGTMSAQKFAATRCSLVQGIIAALDKRTVDISSEFVAATELANFRFWPLHGTKEVEDFGNSKVQTICAHFSNILTSSGVTGEEAVMDWIMLRTNLYNRYKARVQQLTWPEVHAAYGEEYPQALSVINLVRALPASSSDNERGFSSMKLVKTDHRSKMATTTLDNLLTIRMAPPGIKDFNPEPAIDKWMGAAKTSRRPNFRDEHIPKRARLEVKLVEDQDETEVGQKQNVDGKACQQERDDISDDEVDTIFGGSASYEESDEDEGFDDDFSDNEISEEDVMERLATLV